MARLMPEFQKRNVKVIAISCDPVDSHMKWIDDIKAYGDLSGGWPYPIISDPHREIVVNLGMLDPAEKDKAGLPLAARAVSEPASGPCMLATLQRIQFTVCGGRSNASKCVQCARG